MSSAELADSLDALARLFKAEAALLTALDTQKQQCTPLVSFGYSSASVEALSIEYPRQFSTPVQVEIHGGVDPLVYTIGAQPPSRMPFRESSIYRRALSQQDFQDGLTIQLRHGETHVGYAHFSSLEANVYDERFQRYGRALSTVLSKPIVENFSLTGQGWLLLESSGAVERFPGDLPVRSDDDALKSVALSFLQCAAVEVVTFIWADGRRFMRVTLERQEREGVVRIYASPIHAPYGLTATELRVLTGMVVYNSNDAISAALSVGVRTVHSHVNSILRKLDCGSRTHAVVIAIRERLLLPDAETVGDLAEWAMQ